MFISLCCEKNTVVYNKVFELTYVTTIIYKFINYIKKVFELAYSNFIVILGEKVISIFTKS